MYKIKELDKLNVIAQLNLQDKVIATRPLFTSRKEECERKILVVT